MNKPQANDKFYPDKTYRYFPGVAMIHAIEDASFQQQLEAITQTMQQTPLSLTESVILNIEVYRAI